MKESLERFKMKNYGFITDVSCLGDKKVLNSYHIWCNMISRCYNSNNKDYKTYGEKGVYVCDEWKLFSNFKNWYDLNYIEGYHLDKDLLSLNGDINYSPLTCKFIHPTDNIIESRIRNPDSYNRGCDNSMARDKRYYETYYVFRANFKKVCNTQGWDFNSFKEVGDGFWYHHEGHRRKRKFVYFEKLEGEEFINIDYDKRDEYFYKNHLIRRAEFKKICLRNKWKFTDFTELYENVKTKQGVKKYVYIYNK